MFEVDYPFLPKKQLVKEWCAFPFPQEIGEGYRFYFFMFFLYIMFYAHNVPRIYATWQHLFFWPRGKHICRSNSIEPKRQKRKKKNVAWGFSECFPAILKIRWPYWWQFVQTSQLENQWNDDELYHTWFVCRFVLLHWYEIASVNSCFVGNVFSGAGCSNVNKYYSTL